jgi:hypothetical protein
MAPKKQNQERAVVVTTEHRGVFFGYATNTVGDPITLKRARLCLYWSADVKGFMGLASSGPSSGCRIGPAVEEIELRKITSVIAVSAEAAAKWESAPWA